jgi:hypothetical protein
MEPESYEVALLKSQLAKRVGIFACNEYVVYSSKDIVLTTETESATVRTNVLEGSLSAVADSAGAFFSLWEGVVADKHFDSYDWTAKVDADAVFLPQRLRQRMKSFDPDEAVSLNNCKDGLRGPLEILSIGGMKAFSGGIDKCKNKLQGEWHEFGVDVLLGECLDLLKVKRVDDTTLLREASVGEVPMCVGEEVAFHPLTSPEKYFTCLAQTAL